MRLIIEDRAVEPESVTGTVHHKDGSITLNLKDGDPITVAGAAAESLRKRFAEKDKPAKVTKAPAEGE